MLHLICCMSVEQERSSELHRKAITLFEDATDHRELSSFRDATVGASAFDDLCFAWHERQVEAYLAYEDWRREEGVDACRLYRAAQDRADAAEEALENALCARQNVAFTAHGALEHL